MSTIMGILEYGKEQKRDTKTFFDILKNNILKIENRAELVVNKGLKQKIVLITKSNRN